MTTTHTGNIDLENAVTGCLLGGAVGDAIGLPSEGLSRQRVQRMFPKPNQHHFLLDRGMVSDDTEHALMTAQALIVSAGDERIFLRSLSRQLRFWLLALPADAGMATAKATLRLLAGAPPNRSGVFSAGNGPCMRSPIIGVCCGSDLTRLRLLVRASTRITHTDPKAEHGALAIALAANISAVTQGKVWPRDYLRALREALDGNAADLVEMVSKAAVSAAAQESTLLFATKMGHGQAVSGYTYATVPVVLHAWFRHRNNYSAAIQEIIHCGGDTDTTAAILGGIIGAGTGSAGIPKKWLDGLMEWPRTLKWMEKVSRQLAEVVLHGQPGRSVSYFSPGVLPRNALFLFTVLMHGFRRLFPPY